MVISPVIPSLNKVLRDIDAQHIRTEFRLWQCRRSIEIQNLEPFCNSQALDESLSAFSHTRRNARKVAFFPKCFVWIHCSTLSDLIARWRPRARANVFLFSEL
jgi:hypothetical protein